MGHIASHATNYPRICWSYNDDFGCVRIVSTSRYAPHLKIYNLVEFKWFLETGGLKLAEHELLRQQHGEKT